MAKKLTPEELKAKADALIAAGNHIVIIYDVDDEPWQTGWAEYLFEKHAYSNLRSGARFDLTKPNPYA